MGDYKEQLMSEERLSSKEVARQLQQTIEQLQALVVKLNSEAVETLPSEMTLQRLQETTQALTSSLTSPTITEKPPEEIISVETSQQVSTEEDFDEFLEETVTVSTEPPSSFEGIETEEGLLAKILSPIRVILPTGINESLSDGILARILGGILAVILIGTFLLISPQLMETAPDVAESPPIIETPDELASPEPPQAILIEPPPEPEISPEQRLIKAVQTDIADITSRYPEGLIDSIEAYFGESRLVVVLGDDWYQLRPSRQDDVAKGIYQKAKNLDFQKLELVNQQGEILARSPVVGNQMIILVRSI